MRLCTLDVVLPLVPYPGFVFREKKKSFSILFNPPPLPSMFLPCFDDLARGHRFPRRLAAANYPLCRPTLSTGRLYENLSDSTNEIFRPGCLSRCSPTLKISAGSFSFDVNGGVSSGIRPRLAETRRSNGAGM